MSDRFLIIGAGAAGLSAAHALKMRRIAFDVIERADRVGGLWYFGSPGSVAYETLHFNSSKFTTEFPDFPMPDDFPVFPGHRQAHGYLERYAAHFDLLAHVQCGTEVQAIHKLDDGNWRALLRRAGAPAAEPRTYHGVIVASGSHSVANFPGALVQSARAAGIETLHSSDYRSPDIFRGKKVVVVGFGNSGADIVQDASRTAVRTYLSVRRGYWVVPSKAFGVASDKFAEGSHWLPFRLRRFGFRCLQKMIVGDAAHYGLPTPAGKILDSLPVVGVGALQAIDRGEILVRGEVEKFAPGKIWFRDEPTPAEIDLMVFATGFRRETPFLDRAHLDWDEAEGTDLYLHVFHPTDDSLFVMNNVESVAGAWPIFHGQAQAIAAFIDAKNRGRPVAEFFRAQWRKAPPDLKRGMFSRGPRTRYAVDHLHYLKILRAWTRKLERGRP